MQVFKKEKTVIHLSNSEVYEAVFEYVQKHVVGFEGVKMSAMLDATGNKPVTAEVSCSVETRVSPSAYKKELQEAKMGRD